MSSFKKFNSFGIVSCGTIGSDGSCSIFGCGKLGSGIGLPGGAPKRRASKESVSPIDHSILTFRPNRLRPRDAGKRCPWQLEWIRHLEQRSWCHSTRSTRRSTWNSALSTLKAQKELSKSLIITLHFFLLFLILTMNFHCLFSMCRYFISVTLIFQSRQCTESSI